MNKKLLIVIIIFGWLTVDNVSSIALKRKVNQNRGGSSGYGYSFNYEIIRIPNDIRNQSDPQRTYRTTPNPYRYQYQTPSQRTYRTEFGTEYTKTSRIVYIDTYTVINV